MQMLAAAGKEKEKQLIPKLKELFKHNLRSSSIGNDF